MFSPWGQDEAWNDLWAFSFHGGVMAYKCGPDEACVAQLRQHIDAALSMLDEIDLAGAADALFSLSLDAVSEDGRSPYTPAEVYAARSVLVERIARWPDKVRLEMGL